MRGGGSFPSIKEPETIRETAVRLLTDAILSGKVRPGEKLNESKLARQFRVSRSPVREALQELVEQGLIIKIPRRGMLVVSLSQEDVQKINGLRVILEAEALRLARARLTPEANEKLAQLVDRLEHMNGAPMREQVALDIEFHRTMWKLSGNAYLEKILNSLTAPLLAHAMLQMLRSEEQKNVLLSHRPLLDFVRGDSTDSGQDVMLAHLSARWGGPGKSSSFGNAVENVS
jgi:DNA-binding GntR family transcriptional regulator